MKKKQKNFSGEYRKAKAAAVKLKVQLHESIDSYDRVLSAIKDKPVLAVQAILSSAATPVKSKRSYFRKKRKSNYLTSFKIQSNLISDIDLTTANMEEPKLVVTSGIR